MRPKTRAVEAKVDSSEVDRCIFDDKVIWKQIKDYEEFVEKALGLLPENPSSEEASAVAQTLKRIDEVQEELELLRARVSFDHFAEAVITDDETGLPIKQAPIHRRWTQLCQEHRHLIIWSHRNSGKTTQLSIARTVWELGRDPTLRFLILSNTAEIAQRIVKAIANLIKNSATVKKIFPHLEPNPEGPWTNNQLQVVRDSHSKDPSVRAAGIHGAVTSARVDRAIIDDILDFENSSTDKERKKTMAWYKATVPGCLTRRSRVLVVGTAYHPSDFLHEMSKVRGYKWFRFPLISKTGAITWPEAWDRERIEGLREELGPAEFARQALCKARDDDESRFKQDWIDKALERGTGLSLLVSIEDLPEEEREQLAGVFTGVDLSTGKKKKRSDRTAFFTFVQYKNGDRRVVMVDSGKFTGPTIIEKVEQNHERYGAYIAVEDNGAQSYILQFATAGSNVPVVPHTTTKAKRDPILGVEGLAIELSNGKWIIPRSEGGAIHPEVAEWIQEMLFFDPKTHTGDRLMSCYFARELAGRMVGQARSSLPQAVVRVVSEAPSDPNDQETYREGVSLKKLFDVPPGP